jgi:hypothetical protein
MRKEKQRQRTEAEDMAVLRRAVERAMTDKNAAAQGVAREPPGRLEDEPDNDLFRIQLAYQLRGRICTSPHRCLNRRCRRLGRCRELLKIGRLRGAHRARVAGEGGIAGKRGAYGAARKQRNH